MPKKDTFDRELSLVTADKNYRYYARIKVGDQIREDYVKWSPSKKRWMMRNGWTHNDMVVHPIELLERIGKVR